MIVSHPPSVRSSTRSTGIPLQRITIGEQGIQAWRAAWMGYRIATACSVCGSISARGCMLVVPHAGRWPVRLLYWTVQAVVSPCWLCQAILCSPVTISGDGHSQFPVRTDVSYVAGPVSKGVLFVVVPLPYVLAALPCGTYPPLPRCSGYRKYASVGSMLVSGKIMACCLSTLCTHVPMSNVVHEIGAKANRGPATANGS